MYRLEVSPAADRDLERLKQRIRRHDFERLRTAVRGLANEPQRTECGAPDFLVTKGAFQFGYMEAKDVGKSLDETEKTDQLKRYLNSLTNLVLTDYLEFRWFVDGERRLSAHLGTSTKEAKARRQLRHPSRSRKLKDYLE